ncbi:MAG: ArnT family glycosyltransferase [Saprospiraceae bacterium]
MRISDTYYLPLLLFLVTMLAFFKLAKHPLYEWDESHTAINAIEMMQNGDIFNLYYVGEPDELRAKPPLFIWTVALSFELFGASKWSLRVPSALFTIIAFWLIFKIINLYRDKEFALLTCLILLPVKAIIGFHVGRTGDFDAMLLVFLLAGLYFLLKYLDSDDISPASFKRGIEQRTINLYLSSLFFGLAFWTKGPAMAVLSPGILLYLLVTKRLKAFLLKKEAWIALAITLLFPIVWFTIVHFYGVKVEQPQYAGADSFQRMFLYDLMERFTNPTFENQAEATSGWYFFECLTESFTIWDWVFYIVVISGIIAKIKGNWQIPPISFSQRLLVLSICIWTTLGLFLSIVTTAKWWYFAPAFPFIAITTYWGIDALDRYVRRSVRFTKLQKFSKPKSGLTPVKIAFLLFLFATMARRYYVSINTQNYKLAELAAGYCPLLKDGQKLTFLNKLPRQDVLGQLYLCNPELSFQQENASFPRKSVDNYNLVLIHKEDFYESEQWRFFNKISEDDYYLIFARK